MRLLLQDHSKLAAARGKRAGGNYSELDYVVYSPCALCKEDPTRPPLWQIKAVKVIHDQKEKTIEFEDATLELFGLPILYTPYLSIPDPTVKRKSGFLEPSPGYSRNLGFNLRVPYYWAIDTDKELTFSPLLTSKEGFVAYGDYRQRFDNGTLKVIASGTMALNDTAEAAIEEGDFRGHIDSSGRFDIDENWRWGFDALRETDKAYLRLYRLGYPDERTLTSRLFAEGFYGRDYAIGQAYSFQSTRTIDRNAEQPIVAPMFDYYYVGEPDALGGSLSFRGDTMVLSRLEGRESRRLSFGGGWTLPYTSPLGDVYTLTASLRGDLYSVDDVDPNSNDVNPAGATESGVTGRIFPQLALDWRYPFVRDHEGFRDIVEPIIAMSVAPNIGNPGEIPNEDSLDIGFDESNLFDPNRFVGLDRVDTGQRISYGLKWGVYGDGGASGSILLGQSLQFNGNDDVDQASGVDGHLSDIVGALDVTPGDYLDLSYRFAFDPESVELKRNEVNLQTGTSGVIPSIRASLTYSFLSSDADPNNTIGDREEVRGMLSSQLATHWSGYLYGRYDIESDRSVYFGGGVTYEDECFIIGPSLGFDNFNSAGVDPDIRFQLRLVFKNLGSYELAY
jgi:LPS-assembly protein